MEKKIKAALEDIRPYLQRDGGDVEFVAYTEDNIVQVRLRGACHGCPHANLTIKNGIEKILREQFPEIEGVEAV